VQAVQTAEGLVKADVVVLAAGPWSPALASPVGIPLDVRPSRGQLAVLRPRGSVLQRMLTWRSSYLVPKPDGTVVAGTTEEDVGFDDRTTAEGVAGLLEFAIRAVPALGSAAVERSSAALRPMTSDGRPVIGPPPDFPNLVVATGLNHVDQAPDALTALRRAVEELDPFALGALHVIASITGSLVLALAVADNAANGAQAFHLSRIDETYQAEKWGEDAEAAKRATALAHELDKAVELMTASRPAA